MKIKISEENKILIYTLIIVSLGLHINIGIINDLTVMYLCSIIPFLSETVSFYAKENKLILISHLLHRAEKMSKYKYRSLRHRRIAYNKE